MMRDRERLGGPSVSPTPTRTMNVSWAAIIAAVFLVMAWIGAVIGLVNNEYSLLAASGVSAVVGVGWAVLALRDET